MFKIVQAVGYLHNCNYIHRDIKPANILLNRKENNDFEVKLADFGHSRFIGRRKNILT